MRVYLSLGSNLGVREAYLAGAVEGLGGLDPGIVVSPVYETAPIGGPDGQGRYLNCVVRLETDLSPRELLECAHELEAGARRVREVKDGPRTLDVDILLAGDLAVDEPDLVIPHPRMYERAFVLAPLEDIAPDLVPAGWRRRLGGDDGDRSLDYLVVKVGTLPRAGHDGHP